MIQSLDLFYGACKYNRLNRSRSLVRMSPDTSKAEENEAEEVAEVELRGGRRQWRKQSMGVGRPNMKMETMVSMKTQRVDSLHAVAKVALVYSLSCA